MKKNTVLVILAFFAYIAQSTAQEKITVEPGDSVTVVYTASIDENVIDQATSENPLTFVAGNGDMIRGFEKGIIGMHRHETKVFVVPPEDAYGMPDPSAYIEIKRSQLPEGMEPHVGSIITLPDLDNYTVTVKEVDGDKVVLDANHQFSGKEIKFVVTVQDIE
ncbi:MAG: FKBP-type peptidyl-prolyl cis-trans isomerase [Candidatus Auribacterota bacterium]|jgi:FKBP-type peptidyl-prolyl cis-trans isomerase SlpA|nr:FKBP-type peptidyl-prolyl cis-trans isomerase [Candidatus Auribacterota bacterium]